MSLNRLIFYSAMIGGWAAFVGWFLGELILLQRSPYPGVMVIFFTTALVGAFIAGGLTLLGGIASGSLQGQLYRLLPGLGGGFAAGAISGLIANLGFLILPKLVAQLLGWTIMGLAIGAVEGLYDRSQKKIRNGLIGGAVGGFLGGLLYEPMLDMVGGVMSSRAAAFVILGMCIGFFIGLAQVILKEAWLTVEAGFRPGRQLVLSMPEIIMGTSEKAALPFIAFGAKGVEPIHLRIVRQEDGSYRLQDNNSRTGTFVNGQHVQGEVMLRNGDAIQLGVNVVRFRETHKHVASAGAPPAQPAAASARPVAPASPAITAAPLPTAKAVPSAPPSRPKPPPVPPGAVPRPSPIAAGPPAKSPSSPGIAARPPARPASASPAAPAPPSPSAAAPGLQGCPICGRPGAAVAQSNKRRCTSCGILY